MKRAVGITGAALAAMLGLMVRGAAAQCCGDCSGDGAVTVDEILTAVNHALTSCSDDGICSTARCRDDLATCTDTLNTCTGNLNTCTGDLSNCTGDLGTCEAKLAQVTASKPRFIDNGDGTVTDTKTGLMWEKKTTDGSVHDVTKAFTWSTGFTNNFDGTAKTAFLDILNDVAGSGAHCFAGYCDWRLPTSGGNPAGSSGEAAELETILDTTQGYCGGGTSGACVVPALGLTQSNFGYYWSASTLATYPSNAWFVSFSYGGVSEGLKTNYNYVRAVRSGL